MRAGEVSELEAWPKRGSPAYRGGRVEAVPVDGGLRRSRVLTGYASIKPNAEQSSPYKQYSEEDQFGKSSDFSSSEQDQQENINNGHYSFIRGLQSASPQHDGEADPVLPRGADILDAPDEEAVAEEDSSTGLEAPSRAL